MAFLHRLNSPKFDFTQNRRGGKMIKFQQSQALTSHFESIWSIVQPSLRVKLRITTLETKQLLFVKSAPKLYKVGNTVNI